MSRVYARCLASDARPELITLLRPVGEPEDYPMAGLPAKCIVHTPAHTRTHPHTPRHTEVHRQPEAGTNHKLNDGQTAPGGSKRRMNDA